MAGIWVITSNRGLLDAATEVDVLFIESLARTSLKAGNPSYRTSLVESARRLRSKLSADMVIMLGSIATDKYVRLNPDPSAMCLHHFLADCNASSVEGSPS